MRFFIFISAEEKPDLVSKAIMWKLDTNYSHIGIGIADDDGEIHTLYHSIGDGYTKQPTESWLKKGKIINGVKEIKVINADQAIGYLEGNIGKDYSESQYLGFVIPSLARFFANGVSKQICSEAVALFLMNHLEGGFEIKKQADFASPKDVWEAI
jgi:hypothetical protein